MNSPNKQFDINKTAKRWAKIMVNAQVSTTEQRELALWLEQDKAHKQAFFQYRQQLIAKQKPYRRVVAAGFAMAASIMLFILMPNMVLESPAVPLELTSIQSKTHVLPDGSRVELNVNSNILVQYTSEQRLITLTKGDAWFDVKADKTRPFIVKHLSVEVKALGTSFAVKTHQNLQVQVTEHSVEVKDKVTNQIRVVEQGEGIIKDHSNWREQTAKELNTALAWREQLIIFDATPLSLALEEISLYLGKDIELVAPIAHDEPVTGRFNTNNANLALEMICEGMGLKQKPLLDKKILLF
ncbi:FecR family protein [Thalassotalea marina]|uniref:Iron dicitrate transporter FecR n=1 Tax=Thalassotalea marina TaxID=1673741 RepID=A0A919BQW3_9GAMM|nr:FecR domain-containing protein [Thalassotalea marina]GHG06024.1 iron dicitrate transporter FecR [Thalassotalea marina]